MNARPIVPLASLAWSYAVVALLLHASSRQHTVASVRCGVPPGKVLGGILHQAGFANLLIYRTTLIPSPEELAWVLKSPLADSAGGAVRRATRDLLRCSRTRFLLDEAEILALGAKPTVKLPDPDSFTGPQGPTLITMSAVGFDSDSSLAAVYWQYHCGFLCAGATITFLTRTPDGGWSPWKSQMFWIS